MGNGADRYFNDNREALAAVLIRNAIQTFEISDTNSDDVYEDMRSWFGVKP